MTESRWTLWAMYEDDLVPRSVGFNRLEQAVHGAVSFVERPATLQPKWIKVFASGKEHDIRLRWHNERGFHDLSRTAEEILAEEGYV